MGRPRAQLAGMRFGRVVVICDTGRTDSQRRSVWLCKCDCGGEKELTPHDLRTRNVSCGCRAGNPSHGMTNTPLYSVWSGVNNRCRFRDDYAGRGIFVCERWQSFENFYADMAAGYGPGLQIDRIDTKGPYSPENCRWVTMKENVRNRVVTVMVMFRGQRIPLAEACEIAGVDYTRARTRINLGFTEEADIFSTTPLRKRWGKRPAGVPRSAGASNPARSLRY